MLRIANQTSRCISSSASSHYDIVIVGGGLVGNALAASIGRSSIIGSRKVLVLDSSPSPSKPLDSSSVYSNRVSAVSPSSVQFFKKLGIWTKLVDYRVKRVNKLHVRESCSQAEITFDQPDSSEIAYIIENNAIVTLLSQLISTFPSVSRRLGAKAAKCELPEDDRKLASVKLEDGQTITAELVVGADGASSIVRSSSLLDSSSWKYDQSALVATLRIATEGDNDVAWQRFAPRGPIALLPLTKDLSSLVWTTSPEEAKRLASLPKDVFVDELNNALMTSSYQDSLVNKTLFTLDSLASFTRPPSKFTSIPHVIDVQGDNRAFFPLGFSHTHSYISHRVALVGDAAHLMHPLAGQGVNLGWRDCSLLTSSLEQAHTSGADLGSISSLRDYDSSAQRFNVPTMIGVDWLNRLFSTQSTPLVLARSLGLSTFNSLLPLKDLLVHSISQSPRPWTYR